MVYVGWQLRDSVYSSYHCHVGGILYCSKVTYACKLLSVELCTSRDRHSANNFGVKIVG